MYSVVMVSETFIVELLGFRVVHVLFILLIPREKNQVCRAWDVITTGTSAINSLGTPLCLYLHFASLDWYAE